MRGDVNLSQVAAVRAVAALVLGVLVCVAGSGPRSRSEVCGREQRFLTAEADDLVLPLVATGPFSYQAVNVTDQRCDPDSLLGGVRWRRRLDGGRRRWSLAMLPD